MLFSNLIIKRKDMQMKQDNIFINSKIPTPLTKEQTYEYFKQYNFGNKEARKKLIEHNIRLVLYEVSRKFSKFNCDNEDLVSVGIIGLIKGVETFDISKSFEFATYATKCIDNEILMFLRKNKKHIENYSFEDIVIQFNGGGDVNLEGILANDEDLVIEYEEKENRQLLKELIEQLPDLEKETIKLYYGFGNGVSHTQKEIAEKFNYSQTYISRVIKKGLLKLENLLKEFGDDNVKQNFDSKLKKKVFK